MKHCTLIHTFIIAALCIAPAYAMDDDGDQQTDNVMQQVIKTAQTNASSIIARAIPITLCMSAINVPLHSSLDLVLFQTNPYYSSSVIKVACSSLVSRTLSTSLTDAHIIPPAPRASNPIQSLTHLAIDFATGYAVSTAVDLLITQNFKNHYLAKGKLIQELSGQRILTADEYAAFQEKFPEDNRFMPIEWPHWNPKDNPNTKHIAMESSQVCMKRPNALEQSARLLAYRIWQKKSALIVGEKIPLSDTEEFLRVTRYETAGTFWNYNLPFGTEKLRTAMTQLSRTIQENHITMANIPINDMWPLTTQQE